MDAKKGSLVLIKQFFGMTMSETKAEVEKLTDVDRAQLGSAIAREQGLTQEQVSFEMVAY